MHTSIYFCCCCMRFFAKNIKILRVVLVVALWLSIFTAPACRGSKGPRNAYKSQKVAIKESNKEHEEVLKSHYERQSDVTKQMMKDMKKENKRIKKSHKRSLWDRLFNNKCK
ncbi:MAG: hypothetical protein V2I62_03585 [Bacteroidales bacterium]|nr:hypothetical protein [Bacteroidales bacterium]